MVTVQLCPLPLKTFLASLPPPSSPLILLPAKVGGLLDNKGYGIGLPPSELINTKQWRETFPFSQFATFGLQPGIFRFLPSDWQSHKKVESVKLFNIYFDSKLFLQSWCPTGRIWSILGTIMKTGCLHTNIYTVTALIYALFYCCHYIGRLASRKINDTVLTK